MSKAMILNMISLHRKLLVRTAQIGLRNISSSNALRKNLYETLGLTRDATQADIKNAYFELSKLYHPDRIAATDENLAKFREVSAAYEILGNEQSRRLYDRGLLGDIRTPGVAESEEPTDPIIKFYKRRQEVNVSASKSYDEVEAWAQTYYSEARKKVSKKQELYSKTAHIGREVDDPAKFAVDIAVILFTMFLFMSNFEDTRAERWVNKIKSLCSC